MKRIVGIALLIACIGSTVSAGEESRRLLVGVVRIQQIFKDFKYAQDMEKSIRVEFEKEEKEIKSLEEQMKTKMEDLQNDPLIRPGGTKFKLGRLEIERLKVLRDDKVAKFRQDTAKRMAEFYREIYKRFRVAVNKYADHYKYDLIITAPDPELSDGTDAGNNPQAVQNEILLRRVQYVGSSTDVTKPVIELMNRIYDTEKAKTTP